MAGFDLSSVLKDVSDLNTEEQLVKIELDKLDPDPENFYSLDGLDELAGNIETVGLQQPLRVRPGEGGRFIVVSGHRRRAACMLIRDGGSQQFKDGVPCIVEYGEASAALRKLRLIYANSSTRQLTSAEQSRQAEEVTRLLYELKEQGVEFPGRMRDHVAEACQLSKTKIARLHAIRENLIQELLRHWDAGEIKEETAYQLSRFPAEIQQLVTEHMAKPNVTRWPYADSLRAVLEDKEKYKLFACPAKSGAQCSNLDTKILKNVFSYSWEMCSPGKCCLDCANSGRSCSAMCPAARDRGAVCAIGDKARALARDAADIEALVLIANGTVIHAGGHCAVIIPGDAADVREVQKIVLMDCREIKARLPLRGDRDGVDLAAVCAGEELPVVSAGDAADLMLRRDRAGKTAALDRAGRAVGAGNAACILDPAHAPLKAAGEDAAGVYPGNAPDVHGAAAGRDRAAHREIADLRPLRDLAEETEAGPLPRHMEARDEAVIAEKAPGKIGHGMEGRVGEVEVRRELKGFTGGIALLRAGVAEAQKILHAVDADALLPLRKRGGHETEQHQERHDPSRNASQSSSPPVKSS